MCHGQEKRHAHTHTHAHARIRVTFSCPICFFSLTGLFACAVALHPFVLSLRVFRQEVTRKTRSLAHQQASYLSSSFLSCRFRQDMPVHPKCSLSNTTHTLADPLFSLCCSTSFNPRHPVSLSLSQHVFLPDRSGMRRLYSYRRVGERESVSSFLRGLPRLTMFSHFLFPLPDCRERAQLTGTRSSHYPPLLHRLALLGHYDFPQCEAVACIARPPSLFRCGSQRE